MAQQDIRYYLNGMLLSLAPTGLTVVATDGHRLALATLPVETDVAKVDVILPRKAVLELVKLLADADTTTRIEVRDNQVAFAFGNIEFITKVVDGRFPDYQKVIPTGYRKHLVLDRSTLQQSLQRAAILSNEKFRGVRWVLTENSLRIVSSNAEQEEAEEELTKFVDEAVLAGLPSVRIVHGKGEGILRKMTRELLRKHSGVGVFRDGEPGEGGAGVTVATLK